jgi:succinyl-CoA synthetase beta subunit
MDYELDRHARRWLESEAAGRDDEADAAFKHAFSSVPDHAPSAEFTRRTLQAVSAAMARDARRTRRARAIVGAAAAVGTIAALYFGAGLIVSALSTAMVTGLDLVVSLVVRGAAAADQGVSVWAVLLGLGRALGAFLTEPKVTATLLLLQGVAAAALFALQRLLGADAESFK